MALSDIKARIKAQLLLVNGIGLVHDRLRNLSSEADADQLMAAGRLNVWMIHREASTLSDEDANQNLVEQKDTILIEGFYAVKDSDDSQAAFDALLDAVLVQINSDRRPPPAGTKLNATVRSANPPFLRKQDFAAYGQNQVLCHHAEIVMQVITRYLQ